MIELLHIELVNDNLKIFDQGWAEHLMALDMEAEADPLAAGKTGLM